MKNDILVGLGFFGCMFLLFALMERYATIAFVIWGGVSWWAWAQTKRDASALSHYPPFIQGVLTFAAASVVLAIPVAVISLIVLLSHLPHAE